MNGSGGGEGRGPLAVLSRSPQRLWPDGVLHHGARVLLLVGLAVLVTALFPPVERMQMGRYAEGELAEENIRAQVPFQIPKGEEELEQDREEARQGVPPTFDYRRESVDSVTARLERFFGHLDSLLYEPDAASPETVEDFLSGNSIQLSPEQIDALGDREQFEMIREAALQAVRRILSEGVADADQLGSFTAQNVTVREGPGSERTVSRSSVLTPPEFHDRALGLLPPGTPPDVQEILRLILIQHVEHSLELNVSATQQDREVAAEAVPRNSGSVIEGEEIVEAGDQITAEQLRKLRAHEDALRAQGLLSEEGGLDLRPVFGAGLLNLLLLAIYGLVLYFFRPQVYTNLRWVLLVSLLVSAYFAGAAVIAQQEFPYVLLPVAFASLAVAVLWDGRMALVLAMVLAVVTGVQPHFPVSGRIVTAITALGGAAAALSVRAVRRRAQTWIFGAIIAGAYAAGLLSLVLIGEQEVGGVGWMLLAAAANAVLSALLAMGFLPVFELFTGITTDQTLLEWTDTNRSLLKKLSLEAPGTYAHTINVANLAESAASAVGANGLLCRVGLYYHDVGKMLKPHYFVENQPAGRNPHDRLKPDTSAAIVKEHVVEGYELAKGENVPDIVADFILEHHGTQRIGFFWEKAKEEYGEENLDVEDFTYPGPRPASKETAIAMLADSVESATRALQDPTPERVRDLIENIVDGKIADGQLDDSPLTLGEIRRIKEQFIKLLSGIYHHRIDYPQTRHLTEKNGEDGGEAQGDAVDAVDGGEEEPASPGSEGSEGSEGGGVAGPDDSGPPPEEA